MRDEVIWSMVRYRQIPGAEQLWDKPVQAAWLSVPLAAKVSMQTCWPGSPTEDLGCLTSQEKGLAPG